LGFSRSVGICLLLRNGSELVRCADTRKFVAAANAVVTERIRKDTERPEAEELAGRQSLPRGHEHRASVAVG
jgi:hypothetical protein